jgi:hypothetical protein
MVGLRDQPPGSHGLAHLTEHLMFGVVQRERGPVLQEDPEALESSDGGYARRYPDREGYFSDAKQEQARRQRPVVAEGVYALVSIFQNAPEGRETATFSPRPDLADQNWPSLLPVSEWITI